MTESEVEIQDSTDRFSLVSSFYGPGAVGSWLCILTSVFVSWTLNNKSRKQDSITNDFIAALIMPTVAASHAFYLLLHRPTDDLFTNMSPDATRYAASIEAPLNVCETFSVAALALFAIARYKRHSWRATCILVVGLFAFSSEITVFILTRTQQRNLPSDSNLSRPFLFNFSRIMVFIVVFVGASLFLVILLEIADAMSLRCNNTEEIEAYYSTSAGQELMNLSFEELVRRRLDGHMNKLAQSEGYLMKFVVHLLSVAMVPLSGGMTLATATGMLQMTTYLATQRWGERLLFFIPKSPVKITELDQAVALSGGIFTLGFSLWDAYRVNQAGTLQENMMEDTMDHRIRWVETMQRGRTARN
ncbi:hypothetical protein QBC38DRAFT_285751 [Podospora fimiseda]|uniref:Uncharacterized protein n=1 Tax=Podospora fimiseda TaxID=252190 RepID=A0AAN7BJN4_9PEZI|nr:hypothetical protein QBC38DRAFT_285751 [Podospora fimiseda]